MGKFPGNCRGSSGEKKFEGRVSTEDDDITASSLDTILGDLNNHDDDDDDYDYTLLRILKCSIPFLFFLFFLMFVFSSSPTLMSRCVSYHHCHILYG